MINFDLLYKSKNVQFSYYKKANDVEKFDTNDLVSKAESIDAYLSQHFSNSSEPSIFFRAKKPSDLFSNATLLYGHLTKGWNIMHFDPDEVSEHWTELDVPSDLSMELTKVYKFSGRHPTSHSKFLEPLQVFGTSGTTSQSKLVPIRKSKLLFNLEASTELYTNCKKMLSVMPLGHVNAICGAMTYCIIKGVDFVHSDFASIVYFDKLMKLERPDLLNCSPFFLESIVKLDRISRALHNLPAHIVCASAPLKEETFVTISSFGSNVRPAYGLSEAVNFSIGFGANDRNSANAIFEKYKYLPTGRALKGNTVKIIDERANELAEGEIGNIAIGGKIVFDGYLNKCVELPFLTSPKGYKLLLTGDRGFKKVLDGCAYIKVTGRNKETINFRGLQYYFTDLENTLRPVVNLDFYISDANIFDITVNRDTSIFIALESSPQLEKFIQNNGDLRKTISKLIGNIPFSIVEIAEIPRTESGKVKRLKRVHYVKKLFE